MAYSPTWWHESKANFAFCNLISPQHGVVRGLHSTPLLQDWKVNVWIILTEMKDCIKFTPLWALPWAYEMPTIFSGARHDPITHFPLIHMVSILGSHSQHVAGRSKFLIYNFPSPSCLTTRKVWRVVHKIINHLWRDQRPWGLQFVCFCLFETGSLC